MLKHVLLSALLFGSASAAWACEGEAQVVATVNTVQMKPNIGCQVTLSGVRFFAENQLCPLSLSEVNASGLILGTKSANECAATLGNEVSGVIEKRDGLFFLN